jgi:hypothetical protein
MRFNSDTRLADYLAPRGREAARSSAFARGARTHAQARYFKKPS